MVFSWPSAIARLDRVRLELGEAEPDHADRQQQHAHDHAEVDHHLARHLAAPAPEVVHHATNRRRRIGISISRYETSVITQP